MENVDSNRELKIGNVAEEIRKSTKNRKKWSYNHQILEVNKQISITLTEENNVLNKNRITGK